MDIESRLQKVESDLHRMKVHVWAVLAVVLFLLSLVLLRVADSGEWLVSVVAVLALAAVVHLLVSAASGLRLFLTRRSADTRLQEKIMREFIAERANTQDQNHP